MIGARLGPYAITARLGEGGMGVVYRGTDSRLDREVAIKVLPATLTADPERLARFDREAKLLAQLHHPNIASVFGLEEADGVRALVMELVDGPTLAERLTVGPLSLAESLSIARQVAEALEEAHEKGIVHRDLKPQNIKAPVDGKVKVLDFGLAKAMAPTSSDPGSSPQLTQSPTITPGTTQVGVILGTAAYMAPEQAAGGTVDRRADIWSFGVVLWEMLTGRRLFEGETVSHVLAGVLKDTPDMTALPAGTPERIVSLIRRCLRRKPRERLQSIGDARMLIDEVLADPHAEDPARVDAAPVVGPPTKSRSPKIAWLIAAAGLAAAGLFAVLWLGSSRSGVGPRSIHATLAPPPGAVLGDTLALSPDGSRVVFEGWDRKSGTRALWLRDLARGKAERLDQTEGGEMPFWSPDGKNIGFFAKGMLKRIDPAGGPAQELCEAPTPRGGAWGPDGRIVFTGSFRVGLSIVGATGGAPKELTKLDASRNEKSHRFPVFLPGGKTILFLAQTAEGGARNDQSGIEVLDLATGKRTRVLTANSSPLYSAGGQILYWRDGTLLAQRFDAGRLSLGGEPVPVANPVSYTQNEQVLASVSNEGTLVFREGTRGSMSRLVWLDRKGLGVAEIRDRELLQGFALSHDGNRLVFASNAVGQGSTDLWVQDLARGAASRLTFEEGGESYPAWSRDDSFIYYSNDRKNDGVIFRRRSDGTGAAEEVGTTPSGIWPGAVAGDGRWMVAGTVAAATGFDLLRFDIATRKITPLVATPFADQDPALSPDDRLLAYASEESGRSEIHVQSLEGDRGRWQVSTESGRRPRWRADGRELFFLSVPDRLMSVEVEPGAVPRFSAPREIFRFPADGYEVAPDGQRFVVATLGEGDPDKPLTLITSWPQLMAKR
ncbi:MAG TPA: protein kinase [Thermoanaerobaculia bacterium]|nr:protein kinase [Thermoanaerobaculia bacterium]